MLMLITLLNDGTLISIGYDNVKASSRPEKWNLKVSGGVFLHMYIPKKNCGELASFSAFKRQHCGLSLTAAWLQVVWVVSTVLGAVACLSSLLLLYYCLESGLENSLFSKFGLPEMPYGKIVTAMYLKVCPLASSCSESGGRHGCLLGGFPYVAHFASIGAGLHFRFPDAVQRPHGRLFLLNAARSASFLRRLHCAYHLHCCCRMFCARLGCLRGS